MLRVTSRKVCHLGSLGAAAGGGWLLYLEPLAGIRSGLNLQTLERSPHHSWPQHHCCRHSMTKQLWNGTGTNFNSATSATFFVLWLRNSAFLGRDNNYKLIIMDLHMNKAAVFVSLIFFSVVAAIARLHVPAEGRMPLRPGWGLKLCPVEAEKTRQNQACN